MLLVFGDDVEVEEKGRFFIYWFPDFPIAPPAAERLRSRG